MLSTGLPHHSYIGAPTLMNNPHTSTIESLSSNGLSSYSFSHHPKSVMTKRHHPYASPSPGGLQSLGHLGGGSPTSGPIRRRISRACDQCNQLRTRCDGKLSCQHCIGKIFEKNNETSLSSLEAEPYYTQYRDAECPVIAQDCSLSIINQIFDSCNCRLQP